MHLDDQGTSDAVVRYLSDPATYVDGDAGVGEVTRIDTHAATVFLAGDRALKIKKPVTFPFLDFSTLEQRRAAIRREFELNRPNAPEIYRGVLVLVRGRDDSLNLVASDAIPQGAEPLEWVLDMARFDEAATLDHLARAPLPASLVDDLARAVVAAEARAPVRPHQRALAGLADYIRQNDEAFRALPDLFPPDGVAALRVAAERRFDEIAPLLDARGKAGLVRLTHGDLHAGNIAVMRGKPVLFDAIEFDDAIATCDILYDAAFLIMDLDERGRRLEANRFLNGWLLATARATGSSADFARGLLMQAEGLKALPFFLMMRAAIRAKVTASKAAYLEEPAATEVRQEARRYFDLALRDLNVVPPMLVAVGGLSGTGKSTLARALAPHVGHMPGALHLRSDQIRKALAGIAEFEPLPPASYTPEASREVYATVRATAKAALEAGWSVIVDTVAARGPERAAFADLAATTGAGFIGLWLEAPRDILAARVTARTGDASDAGAAVVAEQARYETGVIDWLRIDASGTPEATLSKVRAALGI